MLLEMFIKLIYELYSRITTSKYGHLRPQKAIQIGYKLNQNLAQSTR